MNLMPYNFELMFLFFSFASKSKQKLKAISVNFAVKIDAKLENSTFNEKT